MSGSSAKSLPEQVEVIVVGGGIVGASIAYHLTKKGISDVLVLERHQLTGGTTWHAAGLVAQLRSTENQTKLARYSHNLYQTLKEETGQDTGFRAPGAISMASTQHRWEELRRTAGMARYLGITAEEITADEIKERFPLAETNDLLGGIWLPEDSVVGPSDCTMALIRGARNGGATVSEGVGVDDLLTESASGGRTRCVGVRTDDGTEIAAKHVVLACGLWTRHLAEKAGVNVPLMAAEHHYVVTEPIDGIDQDGPILRDPDRWAYLKPEAGGSMLVGLFEPIARPWPASGPPPTDRAFITMDPDPDHLGEWLGPAFDRIPALHETGLRLLFDGPESFTPDDSYILGEAPTLDSLFVAAGFNSIGIQSAGGAGMALAHWITEGEPPFDLHDVDIRRFESWQNDETYLRDRTVEVLGLLYAPHWPTRTYNTARGIKRSPVYDRTEAAGAYFADLNGWDRPMYYARDGAGADGADVANTYDYSWSIEGWHGANAVEHRAVRENVGMFDLSTFSKLRVEGDEAGEILDYLSAGAVNGEVGASMYTQWLNNHGGIEADLTVSRISSDTFWVIGGAGTRQRDLNTLRRATAGRNAQVTDVTETYACIAVMGPNARDLLQGLASVDLGDEAFPFATNQWIGIAGIEVLANRMSYVGELGWELYVSAADAATLWDAIADAGAGHGLELCGYFTLNSLRFEKGYRHWGHDITPDDTPLEAGLSFAIAWDKDADFRGKAALVAQREVGATQRLVQVKLVQEATPDAQLLHHNETLFRNGAPVGYVTGGMWGHTVGAAIGMALAVRGDERVTSDWVDDAEWEIELPGGRVPAEVQLRPWLRSE